MSASESPRWPAARSAASDIGCEDGEDSGNFDDIDDIDAGERSRVRKRNAIAAASIAR